jgi:4-aminobutyrate aminotransferase-like enzyme
LACIEVIEKEGLVKRSAELGEYLRKQLEGLDHKIIGDVRGKCLMVGIELVKDRETKEIFGNNQNVAYEIAQKALERGVIIFGFKGPCPGVISDLIWITPPLIITKEQVDTIVEVVDQSIGEVKKKL